VRGWTESSGLSVADVLAGLSDLPLAGVVVTDISRDGTGDGPDLAGLATVLESGGLAVVASGGVGGTEDLERLAALAAGGRRLEGVIVGRALLSGRLSLADALAACGTSP
jgi:phosphoribosylformimino-5-aminoimidazole carboxamide ribotide isomerase